MILDKNLIVSDGQDFSGASHTELSDFSIDLELVAPPQVGSGEPVNLRIQCLQDWITGDSAIFHLIESAAAVLTSETILKSTGVILVADLIEGAIFDLSVPPERLKLRFLGLQVITAGGGTMAQATLFAGVVWTGQTAKTGWVAETGQAI